MSAPAYREYFVSQLGAGKERSIAISGQFVTVLEASSDFRLALGDDSYFYMEAGLTVRPRDSGGNIQTFAGLRVRNEGPTPIDILLMVGTGDFVDSRVVFGGTAIPVQPISFAAPQPVTQSGPWSVEAVQSGAWAVQQGSAWSVGQDGSWSVGQAGAWNVGQAGVWNVGLSDVDLPRKKRAASVPRFSISVPAGGWPDVVPARTNRAAVHIANDGTETVYIASDGGPAASGFPLVPGERLRIETTVAVRAYNPSSAAVKLTGHEEIF
ncbi:hypothetical protein [Parvibaculum sp.]|uniref:hypothetical protein n=1 Tax=Parvibaculum sp. TaxID=2024848 RepID=UPI003919142E